MYWFLTSCQSSNCRARSFPAHLLGSAQSLSFGAFDLDDDAILNDDRDDAVLQTAECVANLLQRRIRGRMVAAIGGSLRGIVSCFRCFRHCLSSHRKTSLLSTP